MGQNHVPPEERPSGDLRSLHLAMDIQSMYQMQGPEFIPPDAPRPEQRSDPRT